MKGKWPFKPDHITKDGENFAERPLSTLNGTGIIPNDYLVGILTEFASKFKNPNTVIEFPPNRNMPPVRTDATSIHFDLHPPCRKFRECTNAYYCHECDNLHAELFRGLTEDALSSSLSERIHSESYKNDFSARYKLKPNVKLKMHGSNRKSYLEYDCPILGYRELVFPITFEKNVIGVMFVGELCIIELLDTINKQREHFFQTHLNCFDAYNQKKDTQIEPASIIKIHTEWISNPENLYTTEKYDKLIADCYEQIDRLKDRLKTEMRVNRKNFIALRTDECIKNFRTELSTEILLGDEGLQIFWKTVEKVLQILLVDFSAEHICIFGRNRFSTDKPKTLDIVCSTTQSLSLDSKLKFDLTRIPESLTDNITTSTKHPELLSGISKIRLSPERDFIRIFPTSPSLNDLFAIWIRYRRDVLPRLLELDKETDAAFNNAIESFYTIVASKYSSIWASSATDLMEKSWRVLGHETSQVISGIDAIREQYFSKPDKLRRLSNEKVNDINHDIEGLIQQMHFLGERSKHLISKTLEVKKELFWSFGEVLFKWQNMFRLEMLKKKLEFDIIIPNASDPLRPKVFYDKLLFEQLLFNLVDNAVKYCYRGTKIYIDCKKNDSNISSPHILSVTNYGNNVASDSDVYKLFVRGKNVSGKEGLGIGLYVAKRIANIHNGKIEYLSDKISDFNVPLLKAYVFEELPSKWKKERKIIKEYEKLTETKLFDQVVARKPNGEFQYNPTLYELIDSIRQPTYKVTFQVTLPAQESNYEYPIS
jgi:signal transduction histidine kinase